VIAVAFAGVLPQHDTYRDQTVRTPLRPVNRSAQAVGARFAPSMIRQPEGRIWQQVNAMNCERSTEACHVLKVDALYHERRVERLRVFERADGTVSPWSYRAKVGRGTIRMSSVEYRILRFLASRPYRAFSRQRIAAAVTTANQPVTVDTLGRYVKSLRAQLGFYGDLIQSVPYIGYRFKA
jgi:DNA-binding response OmpR family regulator